MNKALDSEVFHNLSTLMKDHIFDIDDPQDREGMKDQLDLQINGGKNIDTVTKQKYKEALSLLTALDALYADHLLEEQDVIDETKRTTAELLADINDNGVTGTEIKTNRSDRYNALRDKQKEIDQEQKDIISDIEDKVNLPQKDKDLLVSFIDKGVLKGVNFMK